MKVLRLVVSVLLITLLAGSLFANGTQESATATKTIKIGWLAPLTGIAAENGQQVTWAAEMIVDLINEQHADV
ncbi:MAG: ABC transporter substrate-binding protein, partial [Bacteroidia bacterium]|nr:ABC transporter substrate-binding protein [Bacteroidia bacterium]